MSVTITPVGTGPYAKSWNITAAANTDVAFQITHGFSVDYVGVAPKFVWHEETNPAAYTKEWTLGVVDSEFINFASAVTSGGGLAGTPQIQVIALLPQSTID